MGDGHTHPEAEAFLKRVINYAGSPGIIRVIGGIMDSGVGFEEDVLNEFIKHLDKNAIQSFIDVLGELRLGPSGISGQRTQSRSSYSR